MQLAEISRARSSPGEVPVILSMMYFQQLLFAMVAEKEKTSNINYIFYKKFLSS